MKKRSRYLVFSEDKKFLEELRHVFSPNQISFKPLSDFPSWEEDTKLVLIDGDDLDWKISQSQLNRFKRKKIPVVYIFSALEGKEVIDVLNNGSIGVLFKDYPPQKVKRVLKNILYNFNYLKRLREIAENEIRIKKFLGVVNSLTSENDINTIMENILNSMVQVFQLESTVFFIVKKNRLSFKMETGQSPRDYSNAEWSLDDSNQEICWLEEIKTKRQPLYISSISRKSYRKYFPINTLLLPLVIRETFIGLIAVFFKANLPKVTPAEINLLKAFADQTSVALENAKLYWDMLKTQEKLIKQEKRDLLNQTIISLNHEINNPLSIISMEAQMLQQKHENNTNKIESRLSKIEQNIERIKKILEKISSLNVENLSLTDYVCGKKMINLNEH